MRATRMTRSSGQLLRNKSKQMQNDLATDSYRFNFVGGEFNSFFFTTKNNVVYEVRFVPSAYLFEE